MDQMHVLDIGVTSLENLASIVSLSDGRLVLHTQMRTLRPELTKAPS